jgi:hypothetical protein
MNLNYARYVDKWIGLGICLVLFALERLLGPAFGRRLSPLRATTPPALDAVPHRPRRVLCIKFYGLGNAVMLLPVLEAVRRRHPDVEIDFLTMTGNVPLLERSGLVRRTLGVDTGALGPFVRTMTAAIVAVRSRGYDTVLDFEQFVKISTILAFLSGARERIGFNTDGQRRGFLYTKRVVYTDSDHMSAIFARLLGPLGIAGDLPAVGFPLRTAERERARAFLAGAGVPPEHFPLVAMHLGIGTTSTRRACRTATSRSWPTPSRSASARPSSSRARAPRSSGPSPRHARACAIPRSTPATGSR